VVGKFDQYRRDLDFDAGYQAFRALGRLLLAEPEDELAKVREKMVKALGPNAGLMTAIVPELVALLGGVARSRGSTDRAGPGAASSGGSAARGRLAKSASGDVPR
jgi:predicted ATPase